MSQDHNLESPRARPALLVSFGRSQVSSVIATAVDFALMLTLNRLFGVWSVIATGVGAFLGAVTNFLLGRYWSFEATHFPSSVQAVRYAVVSLGSLLLNCLGVYLLVDLAGFHIGVGRAIVALAVGLGFNFPLHRYFVFK